jgi:hypothetical protein
LALRDRPGGRDLVVITQIYPPSSLPPGEGAGWGNFFSLFETRSHSVDRLFSIQAIPPSVSWVAGTTGACYQGQWEIILKFVWYGLPEFSSGIVSVAQ